MADSIIYLEEELELILDKYNKELIDIENKLLALSVRKDQIEQRMSALTGREITKAEVFQKRLEGISKLSSMIGAGIDLYRWQQANTIPKKVEFILDNIGQSHSTAMIFDRMLKYDPTLIDNKIRMIEAISAEFGKNVGKKYYIDAEKDNNGKKKFGLLEWKKVKETIKPLK